MRLVALMLVLAIIAVATVKYVESLKNTATGIGPTGGGVGAETNLGDGMGTRTDPGYSAPLDEARAVADQVRRQREEAQDTGF